MRIVLNDLQESYTLVEFNAYGIKVREITLEPEQSAQLPYTSQSTRIFLDCSREIFIYEGDGELHLSQCMRCYDFERIDARELDFYLQKKRFPPHCKDRQGLRDFVACSELNLAALCEKITPPRYHELWESLLEGERESVQVVKL